MKKFMKTIVPVACLIAAFASFGVTYAYLVANDSKVNEFNVGENNIELKEEFTAPEVLEPGIEFDKNPYVRNTGDLPCIVRMRVDFSDSEAEKFCELIGINYGGWSGPYKDGYYYYTKILKPGEETPKLFEKVKIKDKYEENGDTITINDMIDFDIMIYAESKEWRYTDIDDIDDINNHLKPEDILKMWGVSNV